MRLQTNRVRITLQNEWEWEVETLVFEGANRNKFLWQVRNGVFSNFPAMCMRIWRMNLREECPRTPSGLHFLCPRRAGNHGLSVWGSGYTDRFQNTYEREITDNNNRFRSTWLIPCPPDPCIAA